MKIVFAGGLRVEALHGDFRIATDQPPDKGGTGTAPSPFDLFLASIGTCAGYYALSFCRERGLDTAGLEMSLDPVRDGAGKQVVRIAIEVTLPATFPERYRQALLRAVDQCAVKRHLARPPEIEVVLRDPAPHAPTTPRADSTTALPGFPPA